MNKTDDNNLISVIIPVFDVAQYLRRCLNSIINQSYEKLEIILIDDGSKDDSGNICDIFADKDSRIAVFHTANKGLSEARNLGLEMSHGQLYLDSDDFISLDFIEKLYKRLLETDADFVQCRIVNIQSQKNSSGFKRIIGDYFAGIIKLFKENVLNDDTAEVEKLLLTNDEFLRGTFLEKQPVSSWGKLFKRNVAEAVLMPSGRLFEDNAVIVFC